MVVVPIWWFVTKLAMREDGDEGVGGDRMIGVEVVAVGRMLRGLDRGTRATIRGTRSGPLA